MQTIITNELSDIDFMEQNLSFEYIFEQKKIRGNEIYLEKMKKVYAHNVEQIQKKEKIKISFISANSATWCGKELYHFFNNNDRYEVNVIVIPFFNGNKETVYRSYTETLEYFQRENYNVTGTVVDNIDNNKTYEECGEPDIIFYLNPHFVAYPAKWVINAMPNTILPVYIPYGIMVFGGTRLQFNKRAHCQMWRIFCETICQKEMAAKYCDIKDANVVVSGYPKMDAFYQSSTEEFIWKTTGKNNKVKRLIYSPHHSLQEKGKKLEGQYCQFSTFDQNYKFMYEYAKSHPDTTSWVVKPHPLLDIGTIRAGLFADLAEYDAYMEKWDKLPNAQVVRTGTYDHIFKSCDGIINDSVSYLAEVLYAHKPMLFLKSENTLFNDFGEMLWNVHYNCRGNDYKKIEEFIDQVIIGEKDIKKNEREEFFTKYLDYPEYNHCLASEFIFNYINNIMAKL